MEVDAASFPLHLLGLFINISKADFVSFDLELSGIPSRLPNKQPRMGSSRQSLEERYAETKEGADRYQILQVGITCARFDYTENKYILRPYNINLSPLLDERLDFEREFSWQSGAVSFLLGCGFDLAKPFTHGVQYLSREEAAQARQATQDRLNKKNEPADLQLKEEDVDSLDFMRRVREAIAQWKVNESDSISITTHTGLKDQPSTPSISRFEKRLVHQLVRAEHPKLVTISRAKCVQIITFDAEREADNNRRIMKRVEEQIARQTGFRWVFEALAGGDLHHVDPMDIARNTGGAVFSGNVHDLKDQGNRAIERLKTRQPVLVGHNMFTDIVYLYRTFVGELPETLQGFNDVIHKLFPRIIDTKYLATHAGGDLNASPTLQDIAENLSNQPLPAIATHPDHAKYQDHKAYHEAGYDSLLTATIMIRLAAKLGAEREPKLTSVKTTIDGDVEPTQLNGAPQDFIRDGREKVIAHVPLPPVGEATSLKQYSSNKSKSKSRNKQPNLRTTRFQTKNIFDSLRDISLDHSDSEDGDIPISTPPTTNTSPLPAIDAEEVHPIHPTGTWETEFLVPDKSGWFEIEKQERGLMEVVPEFTGDDVFWGEFGNRVRIFGTQEGVWEINGGRW